jgi:hypothetical protein
MSFIILFELILHKNAQLIINTKYILFKGKQRRGQNKAKQRERETKEKQGRKGLQEQSKGKEQEQAQNASQNCVIPILRKKQDP